MEVGGEFQLRCHGIQKHKTMMYQLAPHARHTDALQVWALVHLDVTAESHHQLRYHVFIIERIKVLRPSLACETCKATLKKVLHSVFLVRGMSYCLSGYKTLILKLSNRVRREPKHLKDQFGSKTYRILQK